jgi:hypothetical protein
MDVASYPQVLLGLDIGRVTTRASLFGILEGKYRFLGQANAPTSLGAGRHLGEGVGEALTRLQAEMGRKILNEDGSLIQPATLSGDGLDQIFLVTDAGPRIRTVVLGLTMEGSLAAGQALIGSMSLDLVGVFGLSDLRSDPALINRLIELHPALIVMTGGENDGMIDAVDTWVEMVRKLCLLLPAVGKPEVIYAGNPELQEQVSRRLEPYVDVHYAPNLMPMSDRYDLGPSQALIDEVVRQKWQESLPGWKDLSRIAGDRSATVSLGLNRMMRFLSLSSTEPDSDRGVAALDLGGGHVGLAVGWDGETFAVLEAINNGQLNPDLATWSAADWHWLSEDLKPEQVLGYAAARSLYPAVVPITAEELAIEHALGHRHLQKAFRLLGERYPGFHGIDENGLTAHLEPIIVNGALFTDAPDPGKNMLTVLDTLQPHGVTTVVLDRYQLLPLLGVVAQSLPILPVHLLETEVFQSLGTVIVPDSPAAEGEHVLTVEVQKEAGNNFSVDVTQGTLRRLVIQVDETAVLLLKPTRDTDVGFGGPGIGGKLKVTGGALGVVMDARGRPLTLPDDDEARVALLQRWQWTLGG